MKKSEKATLKTLLFIKVKIMLSDWERYPVLIIAHKVNRAYPGLIAADFSYYTELWSSATACSD